MVLCMTRPKRVRQIVAENLDRLMGPHGSPERLPQSFLRKSGSNATVGRMLKPSGPRGPTLASLDELAAYFKLEPWQLLIDGLDPRHPPRLIRDAALEEEFRRRVAELVEELGIDRRRDH